MDADAATESLKEVMEQHSMGLPIPSDRLVTIERWDRYVIIQASFGHKVNRVLARVVAHIISERLGQSVAVHQDPYRIILEVDASPELVEDDASEGWRTRTWGSSPGRRSSGPGYSSGA